MRIRSRSAIAALVVSALALTAAACGDDGNDDAGDAPDTESTEPSSTEPSSTEPASTEPASTDGGGGEVPDGPTIVIGAQDFGESAILAQIYGQALEAAGYPVEQQALGGFRDIVFTSFDSGDINFTAEYAASALEFLNEFAGEATPDIDETAELLQGHLAERGLVALDPSPAVDSNSFVVTQATADELGLSAVSDLTDDLTLGGPPDCPENAFCIPGLIEVYGIDLSANFTPLDGGGPLTKAALEGGEIDVGIIFSTDSAIADKGWVVLDDDKGLINADNVIPVMSQELVDTYGDDFTALINSISAALDTAGLTELNRRFDVEAEDADAIALDWLQSEGLIP